MVCPRCGSENLEGLDRCSNCMEPLRDRDVPQPTDGFQQLLMEEPVRALAGAQPIMLSPESSVASAVKEMRARATGCVLVVENGALTGIFTERDLLLSLIDSGKDLEMVPLGDVMTRMPDTVEATDSLRFALNKMSIGGFRNIPIIENGRIAGLVTAKDALSFLARELVND